MRASVRCFLWVGAALSCGAAMPSYAIDCEGKPADAVGEIESVADGAPPFMVYFKKPAGACQVDYFAVGGRDGPFKSVPPACKPGATATAHGVAHTDEDDLIGLYPVDRLICK